MILCYLDTFIIQIPSRPPTTRPIRRRRHIQRPGCGVPGSSHGVIIGMPCQKTSKNMGFFWGSDVRHSFNSMSFVVILMFAAEVPNAVPKAHLALFHSPGPPRRMQVCSRVPFSGKSHPKRENKKESQFVSIQNSSADIEI